MHKQIISPSHFLLSDTYVLSSLEMIFLKSFLRSFFHFLYQLILFSFFAKSPSYILGSENFEIRKCICLCANFAIKVRTVHMCVRVCKYVLLCDVLCIVRFCLPIVRWLALYDYKYVRTCARGNMWLCLSAYGTVMMACWRAVHTEGTYRMTYAPWLCQLSASVNELL